MKKIFRFLICICIIAILTFSSFSLTYADNTIVDTERVSIIEAVKKGAYLYEILCGHAWDVGPVIEKLPNADENVLKYSQGFLCKDCRIIREKFDNSSSKWISYFETHFKSEEEYVEYVNSIFIDNEADIKKENRTKMIDGKLYLCSNYDAGVRVFVWDFENCKIEKIDKKIVVSLKSLPISDYPDAKCTVELLKNGEEYQIVGGTMFGGDNGVYDEYYVDLYSSNPPQTGENTFFYLIISASALACMTALLVKRKSQRV